MTRVLALTLATMTVSSLSVAQELRVGRTWTIAWRSVYDSQGRVQQVPIFALLDSIDRSRSGVRYTSPPQLAIAARLAGRFRQARRAGNADAAAQVLSDQFYDVGVDGTGRTKAALLASLAGSKLDTLSTGPLTARVSDNAVSIAGQETQVAGSRTERALFTHVYVRESRDEWRLLS